jgi:cytochrome c
VEARSPAAPVRSSTAPPPADASPASLAMPPMLDIRPILIALVLLLAAIALLPLVAFGAAGDPAKGKAIYQRCQGCHSIDRNRVGPMHLALFGRRAGSLEGFAYSKAMRESGIVWNEATLDKFLENPRGVVPGTKMTYAGVKDAQERADLIAYLKQATKPSE